MEVLRTRTEVRTALTDARRPVGLVPTMGGLHDGHRSLLRRARADNATVVATIFVNPRQFGEPADFEAYLRDEPADLAACEADGVDLVWAPPVDEVYPAGFQTGVSVGPLAAPLEGAARPGHFDAVATVVAILFGVVGAERAYFGQKDAQQVLVVRQMAADLGIATEVVACPTIREADGLAMSSRNVRLSPSERAAAPILYRALTAARNAVLAGEREAERLRTAMRATLRTEPLVTPDYVSAADPVTLAELDRIAGLVLVSLAARVGDVRLIDNEVVDAAAERRS